MPHIGCQWMIILFLQGFLCKVETWAGMVWCYSKSLAHLTTNNGSDATPRSSRRSRSCCCCAASSLLRVEIIESYFRVNRKVLCKQLKLSELISCVGLDIFACFRFIFLFFIFLSKCNKKLADCWTNTNKNLFMFNHFCSHFQTCWWMELFVCKIILSHIRVGKIVCFPYKPLNFDCKHLWITC